MTKFVCYNDDEIVCELKPHQIENIECSTDGGKYYDGKLSITYTDEAGFYQEIYVDRINRI